VENGVGKWKAHRVFGVHGGKRGIYFTGGESSSDVGKREEKRRRTEVETSRVKRRRRSGTLGRSCYLGSKLVERMERGETAAGGEGGGAAVDQTLEVKGEDPRKEGVSLSG